MWLVFHKNLWAQYTMIVAMHVKDSVFKNMVLVVALVSNEKKKPEEFNSQLNL